MEIKVYISLPHNEKNYERWREIVGRLRGMVNNNRVFITPFGESRLYGPYHNLDELTRILGNIRRFSEVNFIIFGNGWETDSRSQMEHAAAVLYNIPHCGVDELETFFGNYIRETFMLEEAGSDEKEDI